MIHKPTLEHIHLAINIHYGFSNDEIFKNSRKLKYVEPRQMFHYLAHELTNSRITEIASYKRKMNNGTVLHSINQLKGYIEVDYNYRKSVQDVKNILASVLYNKTSESYVRDWLKNNNPEIKINDMYENIVSLLIKFKVELEMSSGIIKAT